MNDVYVAFKSPALSSHAVTPSLQLVNNSRSNQISKVLTSGLHDEAVMSSIRVLSRPSTGKDDPSSTVTSTSSSTTTVRDKLAKDATLAKYQK